MCLCTCRNYLGKEGLLCLSSWTLANKMVLTMLYDSNIKHFKGCNSAFKEVNCFL